MSDKDKCPSCGSAYTGHLGLVDTCKRARELEAALQWALDQGGWKLLYYATGPIPDIINATDMFNARVRLRPQPTP